MPKSSVPVQVDEASVFRLLPKMGRFGVCVPDADGMVAGVIGRFCGAPTAQPFMLEDTSWNEVRRVATLRGNDINVPQRKEGRALWSCRMSADRRGRAAEAEWLAWRERNDGVSDRVVIVVGAADGGPRGFTAKTPRRPKKAGTTSVSGSDPGGLGSLGVELVVQAGTRSPA